MDRGIRDRTAARIVLTVALAIGGLGWISPAPAAAVLPRWTGGVDLYRSGVFTTQKTWLWCTAADVQIMRNIVDHRRDHSRAGQQRYFDYMRRHNRYAIPVRDGVDPAGWAAGLRKFVDSRYRLVASGSFKAALRSAVRNLRLTGLPVGITVSHGNHAWVLTGFTATADPAVTGHFTVTSVRVVGPLWGLQSRAYGYDMRPDRKLTRRQFKGFFTPWHYAGVRMAWEGDWVSIQPRPTAANLARATTSATNGAAVSANAAANTPAASPKPPTASSIATAPAMSPVASLEPAAVALVVGSVATPSASTPRTRFVNARDPAALDFDANLMLLVGVSVIAAGTGLWAARRRRRAHHA
jgi:hypothetical protein